MNKVGVVGRSGLGASALAAAARMDEASMATTEARVAGAGFNSGLARYDWRDIKADQGPVKGSRSYAENLVEETSAKLGQALRSQSVHHIRRSRVKHLAKLVKYGRRTLTGK